MPYMTTRSTSAAYAASLPVSGNLENLNDTDAPLWAHSWQGSHNRVAVMAMGSCRNKNCSVLTWWMFQPWSRWLNTYHASARLFARKSIHATQVRTKVDARMIVLRTMVC